MSPTDQELLAIARAAADAGAAELSRYWGNLSQVRSKGRAGDLVTEADLAAEAAVLQLLQERTPEVAVLAEESGHQPGQNSELQWCVDPLDGTTNYAHGFPFFACSIGLLRHGKPLLGAIAAPGLNQRYSGGLGLGAWCNEEPLHVSSCRALADSLLVTGFAYDRRERIDNNYSEFCYFSHRTHGVRRGGAAALDLAFVAAGRLDGYWERGLQPWDLAAGIALVEAAGGVVCDYDGSPVELSTGRVVATNAALQGPLLQGLAECQPLPPATYNAEIPAGP